MNERELRRTLLDLPLGGIRYYDQIGSTNDVALAWAAEGAADLALVVADEQTAGRGRAGRKWYTPPGTALAFSLILRPRPVERDVIPLYSALGALAVADALQKECGLRAEIKWPNDILLDGRKTGGVLVENTWLGNEIESVVLGVGLNVAPDSVPPAERLDFPATSVEQAAARSVDRFALLRSILAAILAWRPRLGSGEFIRAWEDRLAFRRGQVQVWAENRPVGAGQVEGLDRDGGLRLRSPEGEVFSVRFGEVHLRPV